MIKTARFRAGIGALVLCLTSMLSPSVVAGNFDMNSWFGACADAQSGLWFSRGAMYNQHRINCYNTQSMRPRYLKSQVNLSAQPPGTTNYNRVYKAGSTKSVWIRTGLDNTVRYKCQGTKYTQYTSASSVAANMLLNDGRIVTVKFPFQIARGHFQRQKCG